MLEDYAINFLHGYWNYCLIETDIDVMMLFKFDVKYVRLNFKAIASMKFIFGLKLNLLCSYDGRLFMKTIENYFRKILENSSFMCFDQSKITFDQSSETRTFCLILLTFDC